MTPIEKLRDELAKTFSRNTFKRLDGKPVESEIAIETFKAGFSAALAELSKGAGEFREIHADEACLETIEEPTPRDRQMFCDGARWQFEQDRARIGLITQACEEKLVRQNQTIEDLRLGHHNLTARAENAERELEAWKEIERLSERSRKEIYGMAYKLKPGKYASPLPDIPTCSMAPASVKLHDDLCDILEARAFNEDEVCTASVGIWAAIGMCEKLFALERSQLQEKLAAAEADLLNQEHLRGQTIQKWSDKCSKLEERVKEVEANNEKLFADLCKERK